jgi:hypothetical protein
MKSRNGNWLMEALIVGIAAGAWILVKRPPTPGARSAYPDMAGNFAL